MSERLYKVKGSFEILFPLEDGVNTKTETYMVMEDLIKIALQDGHMKAKNVRVNAIIPDKLVEPVMEMKLRFYSGGGEKFFPSPFQTF